MADSPSGASVGELMCEFRRGSRQAAEQLVAMFYPQLRSLAAARMPGNHTWQPTSLVHELYLELVKMGGLRAAEVDEDERAAFLRLAAFMMKRLLSHHDRRLYRQAAKLEIAEDMVSASPGREQLLYLDQILDRLAAIDPRFRTVVCLKVFEGLNGDEVAARMGCSRRTVNTYWSFARHWLQNEFTGMGADG